MRLPVAAVFVPTLMRTAQTAAPAATYAHRDFPVRLASATVAANEITAWISRALRLIWQGFSRHRHYDVVLIKQAAGESQPRRRTLTGPASPRRSVCAPRVMTF